MGTNKKDYNSICNKLGLATLSKADLSCQDLSGADLSEGDLIATNLSGANLKGANLEYAVLSWANLSGANLSGANLQDADLSFSNLSEANLSDADLRWADLSEANLIRANLSGANLESPSNPTIKERFPQSHLSEISETKPEFTRRLLKWVSVRAFAAGFYRESAHMKFDNDELMHLDDDAFEWLTPLTREYVEMGIDYREQTGFVWNHVDLPCRCPLNYVFQSLGIYESPTEQLGWSEIKERTDKPLN